MPWPRKLCYLVFEQSPWQRNNWKVPKRFETNIGLEKIFKQRDRENCNPVKSRGLGRSKTGGRKIFAITNKFIYILSPIILI